MDWDPPFEIKVYPRSVNDGLEIELGSLKVNCLVNIYLVLAPMLPREEVSLYFMRYPMFYVAGNYRLNGELKKLNWYSCPPPNFTFQAGSTSVLTLGFNLNEDIYVVVRRETPELTADVMYMEKDKYGILHWPLDLVTPSSIVKYLKDDIDVEGGEAGDELATAQSPYKSRAATLESNLRGNYWGGEFQKLLIEDVARLLEHMNREIKRLESKSLTEEREALARLVNPATAVPGNKDE